MEVRKNLLLLLILVTLIISCVPTQVRRFTAEVYPSTRPSDITVVYRYPSRDHIELGEIQSETPAGFDCHEHIFDRMKLEAAKLGAHAVVIVREYRVPDRMATLGFREGKVGIAIRFK